MNIFQEFQRNGTMNRSTNATFISLVPKKSQTLKISDFRPICLVTSLYKIIAKAFMRDCTKLSMRPSQPLKGIFLKGGKFWILFQQPIKWWMRRKRSGEKEWCLKLIFKRGMIMQIWISWSMSQKWRVLAQNGDLATSYPLFRISILVAIKIENLKRDFLWSRIGGGKKDHFLSSEVVCGSKKEGGLGFGETSLRNRALMEKWLWRLCNGKKWPLA